MEKEEKSDSEVNNNDTSNSEEQSNNDPLLKLYLPYKISSTHTLCKTGVKSYMEFSNNDIDNQVQSALGCYESGKYDDAKQLFQAHGVIDKSIVAKYYVSIMLYDGLGGEEDPGKAVQLMKEVVNSNLYNHEKLIHCAQYNIGRAYYEGFGVKQSDEEAERWWLLSARDGEEGGCVKAQSILAMFYSRLKEDTFDLNKAHFWHQEATGNGSLESQTALGMMYAYGMGVEKSKEHSFKCFKSAAKRGSIYAMGNLALNYYQNKMFRNACAVAKKVGSLEDPALLSRQTDCLEAYIKKGVALGCFIYGRCIFKGYIDEATEDTPEMWYTKSANIDSDVAQQMQDLAVEGII